MWQTIKSTLGIFVLFALGGLLVGMTIAAVVLPIVLVANWVLR